MPLNALSNVFSSSWTCESVLNLKMFEYCNEYLVAFDWAILNYLFDDGSFFETLTELLSLIAQLRWIDAWRLAENKLKTSWFQLPVAPEH